MKKRKLLLATVVCVLLVFLFDFMAPFLSHLKSGKQYFGKTYLQLLLPCSSKTKKEMESVINCADQVFSYVGDEVYAPKDVGALKTYFKFNTMSEYRRARREKHEIKFLTAANNGQSGYLWVEYYREITDKNGFSIYRAGKPNAKILSRWTVKKTGDTWQVTSCRDIP